MKRSAFKLTQNIRHMRYGKSSMTVDSLRREPYFRKKQTKRELGLTERFSDEDNEDCEEDELAFYSNREEYCYYDQS